MAGEGRTHFDFRLVIALDLLAAEVGQANGGVQSRAQAVKIRVLGGGTTARSSPPKICGHSMRFALAYGRNWVFAAVECESSLVFALAADVDTGHSVQVVVSCRVGKPQLHGM